MLRTEWNAVRSPLHCTEHSAPIFLGTMLLPHSVCVLLLLAPLYSSAEDDPTQPQRNPCANWMGGAPGYPGHNGLPGRDGKDGKNGEKGDTGEPGVPGQKGEVGNQGPQGPEGPRGFPGARGEMGESPFLLRSAFSMGLTGRVSIPNVPIRFTKAFYNDQRHYDESTGKFRCNIRGLYLFTYHLTVYMKDVKVGLYKNNKPIMFTFDQFQANNVDQASGSILLNLDVGDEVWLQVYGDEFGGIYGDNLNDSSFSGILLYPDQSSK
ncbi:adiponectin isoform X2 [Pyxicephalus adspersus]|uniref:adiponectin isoform X2 n=1 Tax=Pyxicephalus adspersus TaxID=30357 RepID=UPI003B598598